MNYLINRNDPLKKEDTEKQTLGCRCYKPSNCKFCNGPTCGLSNKSHICTTPPKSWPRQYKILKNKSVT